MNELTMNELQTTLTKLQACSEARKWVSAYSTPQEAWDACPRGDWLLWIIGKSITSEPWTDDRKKPLSVALDCAETVKSLWTQQTIDAVSVLREWITGEASVEQAKAARKQIYAAYVATAAAAYATDAAAAAAAAYATDAAAAAYATDAAAAAAYAAAAAAAYAAYAAYAARKGNRLLTARIVRNTYPTPPPYTT